MKFNTFTYESGLRLVYAKVEEYRPMSIYIAVDTGSINETAENNGISHFIEHLTFKGTKKRSDKDIMRNFEEVGARANAYTTQQKTCYYAIGLNEKFEETLEILSDVVLFSNYKEEDIEKERKVIYEEIDMYEDDPSSIAFENFYKVFYAGSSASLTVLGTKESLKGINRKKILEYVQQNYTPNNIVVSVVTSLSFLQVKRLVDKYINQSKFKGVVMSVIEKPKSITTIPDKKFTNIKKDISQTNVVLGFPTDNVYSSDVAAYQVLDGIFGGVNSSRLFSRIRNDEGLVYTIYSIVEMSKLGGHLLIYFGTSDKNAKHAVELVKREINEILENGITDRELERVKIYLKSALLSSKERGMDIANRLAQNILIFNRVISTEDRLREIENVTKEDVMRVANKVFNFSNVCGSVVSKTADTQIFECFE